MCRSHGIPARPSARPIRRGFTLVELLVVMFIILLVSAVVLPTVIPAISHRQVSEAARILQAALAGARDTALNNNAPAGIRLLPDPVFNGINPSVNSPATTFPNQLDPTFILASNRFVPMQLAPDYSEGLVSVLVTPPVFDTGTTFPYPPSLGGGNYPVVAGTPGPILVLQQSVTNPSTGVVNPPTSWYWNIRIGDRIQINNAGISYTVVGPMSVVNPELFVNTGAPGTNPPLTLTIGTVTYHPEFLFLVNGIDDNNDGYVDNGWDGIDNDGDGLIDQVTDTLTTPLTEWVETETWQGAIASGNSTNLPYTVTRRPAVAPGARETLLPSNVVVDLTSWNPGFYNNTAPFNTYGITWVAERSRLPVDPTTGYVDILINPNGTVMPTTVYSSPSSFGMASSFYHFWLSERGDLFDPHAQTGVPYLLPMVAGAANYPSASDLLGTRALSGERRLVTLYTRTGQIITNQVENTNFNGTNPSLPFLLPQQGVRGDTR